MRGAGEVLVPTYLLQNLKQILRFLSFWHYIISVKRGKRVHALSFSLGINKAHKSVCCCYLMVGKV